MNNLSVRLDTCLSRVTHVCSPKGNIYSAFCKYDDGQTDTNCSTMDYKRVDPDSRRTETAANDALSVVTWWVLTFWRELSYKIMYLHLEECMK